MDTRGDQTYMAASITLHTAQAANILRPFPEEPRTWLSAEDREISDDALTKIQKNDLSSSEDNLIAFAILVLLEEELGVVLQRAESCRRRPSIVSCMHATRPTKTGKVSSTLILNFDDNRHSSIFRRDCVVNSFICLIPTTRFHELAARDRHFFLYGEKRLVTSRSADKTRITVEPALKDVAEVETARPLICVLLPDISSFARLYDNFVAATKRIRDWKEAIDIDAAVAKVRDSSLQGRPDDASMQINGSRCQKRKSECMVAVE